MADNWKTQAKAAQYDALKAENAKLRAALVSVKEWIMDPFGPEDFNSKSLHPAFTKALKLTHEAMKD